MIRQRRKSIETSVVGSEKLAGISHAAERAWWRLYFATDHFGTVDVTDVRRLRLAILGEVDGFGSNDALEDALTELIDAGLVVEWSQEWQERERRFVHVVNHDERQTSKFISDRRRSDSRCSPVPPFECCDHARELAEEVAALGPACVLVRGMRGNARHCAALSRIAGQASRPASERDARQRPATPRARKREEEKSGEETSCSCTPTVESAYEQNPHRRGTEAWAQHEVDTAALRRRIEELQALANPDPAMHVAGPHRPDHRDAPPGSARREPRGVPEAGAGDRLHVTGDDLPAAAHRQRRALGPTGSLPTAGELRAAARVTATGGTAA